MLGQASCWTVGDTANAAAARNHDLRAAAAYPAHFSLYDVNQSRWPVKATASQGSRHRGDTTIVLDCAVHRVVRCAEISSLRGFLRLEPRQGVPDDSSPSRSRGSLREARYSRIPGSGRLRLRHRSPGQAGPAERHRAFAGAPRRATTEPCPGLSCRHRPSGGKVERARRAVAKV